MKASFDGRIGPENEDEKSDRNLCLKLHILLTQKSSLQEMELWCCLKTGCDIKYTLCSVTLHMHKSVKRGHYKTCVKLKNMWFLIDDYQV